MVDETQWLRWLQAVTQERSIRGIANRVGVSHTTVSKWVREGVPESRVLELTVRFHGDLVAALVILGHIEPDQVGRLNYAAILEYAPSRALTKELHARTTRAFHTYPDIKLQKRRAIV